MISSQEAEAPTAFKIKGLRRSFGGFVAVDGLDLEVKEGEIYGFLGMNGAGKTTTIQMIMGILTPDKGSIQLLGETNSRTTIEQKQQIGFVSQEQTMYPWMTPIILGKFVGGLYPGWDQTEYFRLLELFEIPLKKKVGQFSGGMKMRLALSLALAPNPKILILDEPTGGMDPVARREFLEIIKHQARAYGRTTFFSSHLLDEVEYVSDRVGIIHKGKKKFEGELSLLQQRVRVVEAGESFDIPDGFELWKKVSDVDKNGDSNGEIKVRYILDADVERWQSSGLQSEQLSLNEIFIACVGMTNLEI